MDIIDEEDFAMPDATGATVERASAEDVAKAIEAELDKVGMTRAQLEAQAKAGRFESERARRTWFVVSSLEPA